MEPSTTTVRPWQTPIVLISLTLAAVVLLYSSSVFSLINFWWNSDNYSHGLLIPLITFYLIWLKKESLAETKATPQPWGALLLLILSFSWLSATTMNIQLIEQVALIALFPTLVWVLLGYSSTKIILFPLAYLLLAAPIWDFITTPLQNLTAIASYKVLQLSGMPILLEEHYITIPAGQFLIEKACAGLRFFITAAAISLLYAHLNYRSIYRQAIFVSTALVGAIILNWIRVCIIIWIGHLSNMEHPMVDDHNSLGWWLFAAGLIPLFYFGSKLQEPEPITPITKTTPLPTIHSKYFFLFPLFCIFVLSIAPAARYFTVTNIQKSEKQLITSIPALSPWSALPTFDSQWEPEFKGAESQFTTNYQNQNSNVQLHISYYLEQEQGAELINELNSLYDDNLWKMSDKNTQQLQLKKGETLLVKELQLENSSQETMLIWYWYRVANRNTAEPITAKLLELMKLTGSSPLSAVVAIATDYTDSPDVARENLKRFILNAYPSIEERLQYP